MSSSQEAKDWRSKEKILNPLREGRLYVYAGAGLSMAAGLVGWDEMAALVWYYLKHYEAGKDLLVCPRIPAKKARRNALLLGEFVKDVVEAGFLTSQDSFGRLVLLNLLLRYRAPRTKFIAVKKARQMEIRRKQNTDRFRCGEEPSAEDLTLHSLVWRTGCHGVFSPNYDTLFEHAYSLYHHRSALRAYRYNAEFLRYIFSNRRFILKIHGDINDIGSMELDPDEAWTSGRFYGTMVGYNLKHAYKTALESGHMIYIGLSFRDKAIEKLHCCGRQSDSPYRRIALMPEKEAAIAGNPCFADITFLTYKDRGEVRPFLERVVDLRRAGRYRDWQPCLEASEIHRQLFLSESGELVRRISTELWSCKSRPLPPPGERNPTRPR